MADYITLLGAEDVSRAGHNMQSAAQTMSQAASSFQETLERQRQFLDEWLDRFTEALEKHAASAENDSRRDDA